MAKFLVSVVLERVLSLADAAGEDGEYHSAAPSLHTPDQPTLNLLHAMERNNVQGMQFKIISCLGFSVRPQGEELIFHLNTKIIKLENAVFFQALYAEHV